MRHKSLIRIGALLAALLLSGTLALRAEYSGNCSSFNFYILILGIIEDPDPIPTITYQPMSGGAGGSSMEVVGGQRDDGRPDEAFDPATGRPVVAWSRSAGGDYDVALSGWDGQSWSAIELLTSSPLDDLDPRVYIDSFRKTYVIWWRADATDKVFLTSRAGGAIHWKDQIQVANDARRPSLVIHDGRLVIAFERDLAGGGQEVVVAFLAGDGAVAAESVATTARSERLDAVVHSSDGQLWVDWKDSDAEFAYSIREEAGWSDPATLAWTDKSWIGEGMMRRTIKAEVLSP